MKAVWLMLAGVVASSSLAHAEGKKEIHKAIEKTTAAIKSDCGCGVQFSYSKGLDFTSKNGSSLALNVRKVVEDIGDRAHQWCKQGEDFRDKLCLMINLVEIDEDASTDRPYTRATGKGTFRSYIATKTNVISNHGGAWVLPFLKEGKMPERKSDD